MHVIPGSAVVRVEVGAGDTVDLVRVADGGDPTDDPSILAVITHDIDLR